MSRAATFESKTNLTSLIDICSETQQKRFWG